MTIETIDYAILKQNYEHTTTQVLVITYTKTENKTNFLAKVSSTKIKLVFMIRYLYCFQN